MAQAGIHGMIGMAVRKLAPQRTWLLLGIVLGNMLPDGDNLAVAVATVARLPTEGLHRSFTHSLCTVALVVAAFYLVGGMSKQPRWTNLGIGLGAGILMHILLDLVVWFNGVYIVWPLPVWVNLWSGVTPPEWFDKLMLSIEFFFFGLFFLWLERQARQQGTDQVYLGRLRIWIWVQFALFVIFTVLVYTLQKGFLIPYGALYLFSLGLSIGVTIRMRQTVDWHDQTLSTSTWRT